MNYSKMMIRCFFVLVLMMLLNSFSFGQSSNQKKYSDRIFLQNGSVLIGEILDYKVDDKIIIELRSGNRLEFSSMQIKKVVMGNAKVKAPRLYEPLKKKKVYHETQLSLLSGVSGTGLSIAYSALYQWSEQVAFGLGAGIDNYYVAPGRDMFPIFLAGKYYLTQTSRSPYLGLKAGYGMAFKNEDERIFEANGGFMINPSFGIRFGTQGLIFNTFIGLKFQEANYLFINAWETRSEDIFFKRFDVGISAMF